MWHTDIQTDRQTDTRWWLLPARRKDELSNYRPISNFSVISKIIERVVKSRLIEHLTYSKLLNPHQSANSGTSSFISRSSIPSPTTSSSSDSPLCTSITPPLFHTRLKTYLFHIPSLVSLFPPGLPPRTFACTVSSELLGFWLYFSLFFFSEPCARLSWLSRQLLSAR